MNEKKSDATCVQGIFKDYSKRTLNIFKILTKAKII